MHVIWLSYQFWVCVMLKNITHKYSSYQILLDFHLGNHLVLLGENFYFYSFLPRTTSGSFHFSKVCITYCF